MSTVRMLSVLVLLVSALMAQTGAADSESGKNQTAVPRLDKRWYTHQTYHFYGHCYRYVPTALTWATAQKHCEAMGGALASVTTMSEYRYIQRVVYSASRGYPETWLGGTDAQEERKWLWSDATPFHFTHWCRGEPNNYGHAQHCMTMNHSGRKCWDDYNCRAARPSVCMQAC